MNRRDFAVRAGATALTLVNRPSTLMAQPPPVRFGILLNFLSCFKTTEAGADEVYIVVYGKRSDGHVVLQRFPGEAVGSPSGHWDMNDGGQPRDNPSGDSGMITNRMLLQDEFTLGQSFDIQVMIMEEDGGSTRDYQTAAAALAARVPNPIVAGAGVILGALTQLGLFKDDTDDFIGSFGLRFDSTYTGYSYHWTPGERIYSDGSPQGLNAVTSYGFNGDGSRYDGTFILQWR